jgi:hypothetical protein
MFSHTNAGYRVDAGTILPSPQPIFPRYVEAETVQAS